MSNSSKVIIIYVIGLIFGALVLKIWDVSEQNAYNASYTVSTGNGTFNGLFSAISEIISTL